jgi:hypothetical protein
MMDVNGQDDFLQAKGRVSIKFDIRYDTMTNEKIMPTTRM